MAENVTIDVYGAGLAGCEAAWQAVKQGVKVRLHEMKPIKYTPAHHSPYTSIVTFSAIAYSIVVGSSAPSSITAVYLQLELWQYIVLLLPFRLNSILPQLGHFISVGASHEENLQSG